MKRCKECDRTLPPEAFGKNATAGDGRMQRCRECNREIVRKHYEKINGTKESRHEQQKTLYEHIKYLRESGYSIKSIAKRTGLDKSTISCYLSGKRTVGMSAVRKFNKATAIRRAEVADTDVE